jgi:hypothetical protein
MFCRVLRLSIFLVVNLSGTTAEANRQTVSSCSAEEVWEEEREKGRKREADEQD